MGHGHGRGNGNRLTFEPDHRGVIVAKAPKEWHGGNQTRAAARDGTCRVSGAALSALRTEGFFPAGTDGTRLVPSRAGDPSSPPHKVNLKTGAIHGCRPHH